MAFKLLSVKVGCVDKYSILQSEQCGNECLSYACSLLKKSIINMGIMKQLLTRITYLKEGMRALLVISTLQETTRVKGASQKLECSDGAGTFHWTILAFLWTGCMPSRMHTVPLDHSSLPLEHSVRPFLLERECSRWEWL